MHNILRTLFFALVTCTGLGVAAQGHLIYVAGHANPCIPAMNGSTITITVVGGEMAQTVTATTTLNENCYYSTQMLVPDTTGEVTVTGSCGNGTAATGSGTYYLQPPATTDVIVDLDCGNTPTTYQVTVQGSVSPCELLDNTVTVRCTSCTPWVETVVPVDANCNYSTVLNVPNMTGTIVVAAGCSNGNVPNNTTQYIVNTGQTGTMVTLLLSCAPAPGEACFTVEETAPFTAQFSNCSTGCLPPFTYLWDISGPGGGTQEGDVINYTFPGPGTYAVCLNIAGMDGCVASTCQQVVVDANGAINPNTTDPCEADFWVIQAFQNGDTIGGEPIANELWIWNLSSGGTGNYQFLWSFGDGTSSSEPFPTHVYAQDGPYVLCLTVYDSNGCSDTHCDSISVDENGMLEGLVVQGNGHHGTLQGERSEGFTINVLDPLTMDVPESELSALNTWPNPTQDRLEISLNSIKNGQVRTEVIDANGRRVVGTMSPLVNGQNRITLDVAPLPAGMYLLRIGEGSQTIVRRFIKN